jgi:site-specific DNA-cytosine methylase
VTIPFLDCQGLAGAWTLGTVLTDRFSLEGRTSLPGGFGDEAMAENRHFTGNKWEQQTGDPLEWEELEGIAYVCGTPPCSGFSLMNASKGDNARGPDSPINSCMRDLIGYAGRVRGTDGELGPEIVSFESVQGAFNQGRSLMQELLLVLRWLTQNDYQLTHVKMSGSSIGAAQMRHRYYPVFHRVPFGCARPGPRKVVTYGDAIGDLVGLECKPEEQPYADLAPSDWVLEQYLLRNDGKVDWHVPWGTDPDNRAVKLFREVEPHWEPGTGMTEAIRNWPEDQPPPRTLLENYRYDESNWRDPRGWHWPRRIHPDKPGYVLTGAGGSGYVHWSEPRYLTIREASRLMGYPDDWRWPHGTNIDIVNSWIGKCCPVQSGRWLSEQVADSLEYPELEHVNPDDHERIGPDEMLFDCTLDYRRWPVGISQYVYKPERKEAAVAG